MPYKDPQVRAAFNREYRLRNIEKFREYHRAYRKRDGQKEKRKEYWRKAAYGINNAEWSWLLNQQNGLCAICQKEEPRYTDHNHRNGKLRGLLCPSCNTGIGLLGDSVEALCKAAAYIERTADGIIVPKLESKIKVVRPNKTTKAAKSLVLADLWDESPAGGECQLSEQGECNGS